jgi:hypothetical protein
LPIEAERLRDDRGLLALLPGLDGGAEPGTTGTDDDDVVVESLDLNLNHESFSSL